NWALAAITLLSLSAVIYFLGKRVTAARVQAEQQPASLSPYDEAIQALKILKDQRLPENGQVKLYYTSLNDIVRSFIWKKLSLATMQKTNEELMLQVQQLGLQHDALIPLAQTLRMSDAVKFAKFVPGIEDNEHSFSNIRSCIESLNNLQNRA
ncbi:MAG: hypothetical protein WKF89_05785, partial [Chitinophagaceae bacterium]